MSANRSFYLASTACVLLMLLLLAPADARAQGLPPASNVVARMLLRSAEVAQTQTNGSYLYEKHSLIEQLDAGGKTIKSTEKIYQVVQIQGLPFTRLVGIKGRQLTESEIKAEDQKEQEFRKKVTTRDLSKMAEKKEPWLTPELVSRFDFTVVKLDSARNRNAIVLDFKPKPSNPEKTISDRLLNRIAGRIWIDEIDAEVAQFNVHMSEPFSLGWFGMVGSLHEFQLALQRQRMPDGVWVNTRQTTLIKARKLFSTMHFRATDTSSAFRRDGEK